MTQEELNERLRKHVQWMAFPHKKVGERLRLEKGLYQGLNFTWCGTGHLTGVQVEDEAVFRHCCFDELKLEKWQAPDAYFDSCQCRLSRWINCDLSGAQFISVGMSGSGFVNCDLSGSHWYNGELTCADFMGRTTLNQATMINCDMVGVTFSVDCAASLKKAQLHAPRMETWSVRTPPKGRGKEYQVSWVQVAFGQHGKRGRTLTLLRWLPKAPITAYCGCFSGTIKSLRSFITRDSHHQPAMVTESRRNALDTALQLMEYEEKLLASKPTK